MTGQWIVLVRTGRAAGRKVVLAPGAAVRVGSAVPSDLAIADDRDLSDVHFTLRADEQGLVLEDAGRGGTWLNGLKTDTASLAHGDWLKAGTTHFSIYREAHSPPPDDLAPAPQSASVLAELRALSEPLYAILDAARSDRVLPLVRESVEEARSLYDGVTGETMAEAAPYLVSLPRGSALLERLVFEGWGRSWGVYLTCARPFVEVRRHLRRFLIVLDDDTEQRLYFRYYDPRVLRVFLPTCTPRQRADLFGDVSAWLMEDETGNLVRFAAGARAARAPGGLDGRA